MPETKRKPEAKGLLAGPSADVDRKRESYQALESSAQALESSAIHNSYFGVHEPNASNDMPAAALNQLTLSVGDAVNAPRLVIDKVGPAVDEGQRPAKAVVHQPVTVDATIFADGHNRLAAQVLWQEAGAAHWNAKRLTLRGNDRWQAVIVPQAPGHHYFCIRAWLDRWQNFHHELHEKFYAQVPVTLEVKEGSLLLQSFAEHWQANEGQGDAGLAVISQDEMPAERALQLLAQTLEHLADARERDDLEEQVRILLDQQLAAAVEVLEPRLFLTQTAQTFVLDVERTEAGFASWYELFPRSVTNQPDHHGTFDDVIERLPAVRDMGFNVLYFPPIHPIGERNRKGKNNSVTAQPEEPGSPYAIGSEEGGHDTVYSRLGGIEAFRRLKEAAQGHGLELAIDFAIQCSPDHPWLAEHPDWFNWRPDGSIRYAENPPKKYQDIVNVEFYAPGAKPQMWVKWRDIVLYWVTEGVKIFRVDNPHTKPLPFWEWLIADIRKTHPEVIFLSEAFTRPAMMYQLAKIGFSQSYTYFIWRNSKQELIDYITELASSPVKDFYRPNFFVNTPDINPYFLQSAGRPGFLIRAALAATLSGLWGVYSGFELCEDAALPGKEEYLNSEKYEIRPRDYNAPGNIVAEITRLNQIRKANPALQSHLGVVFHESHNDRVLYFSKAAEDNRNSILVAVSLDPHQPQEAWLRVPSEVFGLGEHAYFDVTELMRDQRLRWRAGAQHWYFNPQEMPFAIFKITAASA